ncbi:MAG: TlpA family protein disulfide reductase [SAR202 cluster bacterium]|nr:TlpA family protein disulfide reductase [SAR202 cluster bacterium]
MKLSAALLIGLAALTLAACTASPASPGASQTPRADTQDGGAPGEVDVPEDFDITLYTGVNDLGAQLLMFSDLFESGKPVVLNFWAGLCPPCRAEMPDFQEAHEQYAGEVVIVGVDIGPFVGLGSKSDARLLVDQLNITYPTGYTEDHRVVPEYRVLGMPATVFLRPDGSVQRTWTGALNKAKLIELIEALKQDS